MKLDRRGFIKLIVGAGVGIHLTPLPWKLIDDSAIWTQNWPWVPRLSRYPKISHGRTVCTLCDGGCGVSVRLVDGKRSVKAEGLEAAPVNRGGICPLGAAGPQYQYGLARFATPLKRLGARGSGAYARLTWDEAVQDVAGRLNALREKGEAHTVAMITGRHNDLTLRLIERFMSGYGSPNLIRMPSQWDQAEIAEQVQFGSSVGLGYDLENSKYVISFGAQLIEGWGSPVRSIAAYSQWRAGGDTRFVQVDSQATLTASKADEWVAVAPGTEGALALGLAHVLVTQNLYDRSFVEGHGYGFDEFKALLEKEYTPERVAEITGVLPDTIARLAGELAKAKPAVALAGKGKGTMPTPVYDLMAIMSLNALLGSINRTGGVIVRKPLPLAPFPEPEIDDAARKGLAVPRLDLAGSAQYPLSRGSVSEFVKSVNEGRLYPINALILDRANPDFFGADPTAFRTALAKIPLVISLSAQADDSSIQADMVLPSTMPYDGAVDVVNPPTLPYPLFGFAQAVLPASPYEVKPAGDIVIALTRAIGPAVEAAVGVDSYEDAVRTAAIGLFESRRGVILEPDAELPDTVFGGEFPETAFEDAEALVSALEKGMFWFDPSFVDGDLSDAFRTPSGKFEFASQTVQNALAPFLMDKGAEPALALLGVTADADQLYLPHYEPYVPEHHDEKYPLILAPEEQFKMVTSALGNAPYLTKLLEDTTLKGNLLVVHVNPKTARELHLSEGDKALLKTRKGAQTVLVHLFSGARPDVVYAPIGLGHAGFGYYLRGKGVNPMELVEATADPLSGQAMWWGTPANLVKA